MTLILGLLAYAVAAVLAAPFLLTRGRWRTFRPGAALAAWLVAFASGLAALLLGILATISLALGYDRSSGSSFDIMATAVVLASWGLLGGIGATLALVFTKAEPLNAETRHTYEQLAIIAALGRYREEHADGVEVVFIRSETPLATAIPGEAAQIVVSSGMVELLDADALASVISHERAHLHLRHARVAQLAHLNAVCLPWLRAAREFERSTQFLIELIADDRAVRAHGAATVTAALNAVGAATANPGMLLRARRAAAAQQKRELATARWDRLLQI